MDLVGNHQRACIMFAWVTQQAHVVMAQYQENKFQNHKSLSGTFIRFLTRNMADQSAMGLKGKADGIKGDVKSFRRI